MTEQDAATVEPETADTRMGQLLEFPGQRVPAEAADTERAPVPAGEAPHRAPHIPPALRTAGTRTWAASKRAAAVSGRHAVRHGSYALGGAYIASRQAARRLHHGDLADAIRDARTSGDLGTVAELQRLKSQEASARLQRAVTIVKLSAQVAAGIAGTWLSLTTIVAVCGLVAQLIPGGTNWSSVWSESYWAFWVGLAEWVMVIASFWPWMLAATLITAGYAIWNLGRQRDTVPTWAAPQRTDVPADEVQVTADRLITALKNCGIPELKRAIKEGETAGMVDLISQFGPGVRTTITLPRGIPASKLAETEKAKSLASSLSRGEHELSISRLPSNESKADIWIARPGALDEPVPASPMMDPDYGPVDIYRDPVPWGESQQGEPIELELIQRHILIAGLSKQGKTASARALALHAALDPSVELRISDLKGVGDWSMFDGIATTLIEGAGDENELATADMLERAVREMKRRLEARRSKGAKGDITSKEAKDGSGDNHPLFVIVDEVQIAYRSQACEVDIDADGNERPSKRTVGGKGNNARLWQAAKTLHDQGRAVNVHLWQFAQNPNDQNLPAIVREGAHVRGSLYVSNPSIARMAIGGAPVDAGAAPDRLRSEIDAGTLVVAGAPEIVKVKGEMANTVRTNFIDTEPAYEIARRARAIREEARNAAATSDGDVAEARDVLADVVKVLKGEDYLTAKAVVVRLCELAPSYYRGWTGKGLHAHLKADYKVDPGGKDGVPVVRLERVQDALNGRAEAA